MAFFTAVSPAFCQWQSVNSSLSTNLVDGCFVNDSTGFIISSVGDVITTTDRGNTWTLNASLSGVFTSICNVGDTLYAGGNSIYKSNNKGLSWTLISTLPFTVTDLAFFKAKHGFAIVPGYSNCAWNSQNYTYDAFKVYETNDFGISWQQSFGNIEHASKFQLINDSSAYITGGYVNIIAHCSGPWYNASKKTTNNGQTWVQTAQPQLGRSFFSFVNDSVGYFVQAHNLNTIFKTVNQGNTLSQSYTEIYDDSIKQCKFITEIDGYLLAKNNIYVTSSNGFGWMNDHFSPDNLNILFKNKTNLLFAIGDNGLVLKKTLANSPHSDSVYRIKPNLNALDFGYVNKDSVLTKVLKVKNTGSGPINLSIASSNDFKINFIASAYTNSINVTLNAFQDTSIYVQFSPHQIRNYYDTLLFSSTHLTPVKIPLSGIGFLGLNENIVKDTLICTDTIRIGNNITINHGVKVIICAGTYVKMMGNYKITVAGSLHALGNSTGIIRFGIKDTTALWKGIDINNSGYADSTIFNYCEVEAKCNFPSLYVENGLVYVNHCTISNKKPNVGAIYIEESHSKIYITDSKIHDTPGEAVVCDYCDTSYIVNSLITGNYVGIKSYTFNDFTVRNNIISLNQSSGVNGYGRILIQKNKIHDNGAGIYFDGYAIIENNEVFNNYSGGITTGGGGYVRQNVVFNNSVLGREGAGIFIGAGTDFHLTNYVVNNTICNNKSTLNTGNNFYAITNVNNGTDIKLFNNIIYNLTDTANSIALYTLVTYEIAFNSINQNPIPFTHSYTLYDYPNFVSPTDSVGHMVSLGNYDWSIKQQSRCINAGDSLDTSFLSPYDFSNNIRIYNNRVDIGAYEYQGVYDFIVEKDNNFSSIFISPNPFTDNIKITIEEKGKYEITLYDISSRVILKQELTHTKLINTEHLQKGIYIYEVKDENGKSCNGKIIKM